MANNDLPPLDPEKGRWDETAMGRRHFLETSFWTVTGIATLSVGAVGTRFLAGNAFEAKANAWVEVGKLSELDPKLVNRVNYSMRATDAWREVKQTGALYAFSDDNGATYTVLDASCTHLGCVVQWDETTQHYDCPCHAGSFTRAGDVVAGPPPKPLRRLQTKIENAVLLAQI